jgi:hypothetical protein
MSWHDGDSVKEWLKNDKNQEKCCQIIFQRTIFKKTHFIFEKKTSFNFEKKIFLKKYETANCGHKSFLFVILKKNFIFLQVPSGSWIRTLDLRIHSQMVDQCTIIEKMIDI